MTVAVGGGVVLRCCFIITIIITLNHFIAIFCYGWCLVLYEICLTFGQLEAISVGNLF